AANDDRGRMSGRHAAPTEALDGDVRLCGDSSRLVVAVDDRDAADAHVGRASLERPELGAQLADQPLVVVVAETDPVVAADLDPGVPSSRQTRRASIADHTHGPWAGPL